jgi:hypothetical protein
MPFILKKIEKFFPEENLFDKSAMIQEIRVPKNLMYLTDRLPGPSYEEVSHSLMQKNMNKNKSESKFKLPKL